MAEADVAAEASARPHPQRLQRPLVEVEAAVAVAG